MTGKINPHVSKVAPTMTRAWLLLQPAGASQRHYLEVQPPVASRPRPQDPDRDGRAWLPEGVISWRVFTYSNK